MSPYTLTELPLEILVRVLKFVGLGIVEDLIDISPRKSSRQRRFEIPNFAIKMKEFCDVVLVSRTFHKLFMEWVDIDSIPIRRKISEIQTMKFLNLLESHRFIEVLEENHAYICGNFLSTFQLGISHIQSLCGRVWLNPEFPMLLKQVFQYDKWLDRGVLYWFTYIAPTMCKKILTETAMGSILGPNYQRPARGLWSKPTPVEIEVGKYQAGPWVTEDKRTWTGVSILSFKSEDFNIDGKEGQYWLWFVRFRDSIEREWVIDYDTLIVTERFEEYDLRIHGFR